MPIILLPTDKPYPVGYAAFSGGDDFAVSGDGLTWPSGQVSMNTTLGGNRTGGQHMVWDFVAEVWLAPGKAGGGGESFIRSTDALGSSWVAWSGDAPGGAFTELHHIVYDFHNQRLIALDTAGRVAYAPTYTGPWTVTGWTVFPGGSQAKWHDVGWVGGQTVIAFGSNGGTFYSLNGGLTWANVGGATGNSGGGLCFNPVTDTWWNWENTNQLNETATNDISGGFIYSGQNVNSSNNKNLHCNVDTGTMIAIDGVNSRTYGRYTVGSGTWTTINSGNGLPLASIQTVLYDRDNGWWLLGLDGGYVYRSTDDGLTWAIQNGGLQPNSGGQFFNNMNHLGYAQRWLRPHIVP